MNLIFDIDDTLYDQVEPFKKAYFKNFSYEISVSNLFVFSRKYSDQVFEKTQNNKMSVQSMHIYRITKAFECYNIKITKEQALNFQRDYEFFQNNITLSKTIIKIFNYCKNYNINIGIISNGFSLYQWNKIENLGVLKWIDKKNIIISEDVGVAKPNCEIFRICQSKLKLEVHQTYYIGDSFENDVLGAQKAGWKCIWLNKNNKVKDIKDTKNIIIVNDEDDLLKVVKKEFKKSNLEKKL